MLRGKRLPKRAHLRVGTVYHQLGEFGVMKRIHQKSQSVRTGTGLLSMTSSFGVPFKGQRRAPIGKSRHHQTQRDRGPTPGRLRPPFNETPMLS